MKQKYPPKEAVKESLVPHGTRELSLGDLGKAEALVAQIARDFSDLLAKSPKISGLEELRAALPPDHEVHLLSTKPRVDLAQKILEGYWAGKMPLWNDIVCTRFPASRTEAYRRASVANPVAAAAAAEPGAQPPAWPPALPEIGNKELETLVFLPASLYQLHAVTTAAETKERSNERLEFLGDAVLERAACDALYDRFPGDSEGGLTQKKVEMVCNSRLTELALAYGMDARLHALLGAQAPDLVAKLKDKVYADTFEAYIGAVYLDKGYQAVWAWLSALYEPQVAGFEGAAPAALFDKQVRSEHAKARLYRVAGSAERRPEYRCVGAGPPFTVEVWLGGERLGSGTAASKKEAGNLAAEQALNKTSLIEEHARVRRASPRTAPVTRWW